MNGFCPVGNNNVSNSFDSIFARIKISNSSELNDPFEGFFSKEDMKKKIACFSLVSPVNDKNSIYMWSHYANSLKGICIEYDFKGIEGSEVKCGFVEYGKEKKTHNKSSLFHKYLTWKLEKEFRFIFSNESGNFISPQKLSLKINSVYLGVCLLGPNPLDIKKRDVLFRNLDIYKWIRSNDVLKSIPIYGAVRPRPVKSQYRINSVKI